MARLDCKKEVVPFTAMASVECISVSLNTLYKAAAAKGLSYFVYVTYSYALGALVYLPLLFIFPRWWSPLFHLLANHVDLTYPFMFSLSFLEFIRRHSQNGTSPIEALYPLQNSPPLSDRVWNTSRNLLSFLIFRKLIKLFMFGKAGMRVTYAYLKV